MEEEINYTSLVLLLFSESAIYLVGLMHTHTHTHMESERDTSNFIIIIIGLDWLIQYILPVCSTCLFKEKCESVCEKQLVQQGAQTSSCAAASLD